MFTYVVLLYLICVDITPPKVRIDLYQLSLITSINQKKIKIVDTNFRGFMKNCEFA